MEDSECIIPDVPLAKSDEDSLSGQESALDQNFNLLTSNKKGSSTGDITSSSSSGGKPESGSLQDLIQTFDQSVKSLLINMTESTSNIAPVPDRLPGEMLSESEWWTLTGNFGNLPPINFNNTQIQKRQNNESESSICEDDIGFDEDQEEEELRQNLGLRFLKNNGSSSGSAEQPAINADQVIEEIDEMMTMMQGDCLSSKNVMQMKTDESSIDSMYSSVRSPLNAESTLSQSQDFKQRPRFTLEDLKNMPYNKLLSLHVDIEQLISTYNTDLVNELARRDEQEYEKEVKNKFITLVVEIQERRKKCQGDNKRKIFKIGQNVQPAARALTAVIPFNEEKIQANMDVPFIETLNRILEAVLNESSQVPNLLTEYILNVVCPPPNNSRK